MFTNLSEYSIQWVLLENGNEVVKSELITLDLKPGSEERLYLPEINRYISDDKECIIEFSVKTKKSNLWAETNFEVAWEQIVVRPYHYQNTYESKSDIGLTETDQLLFIQTAHNKIVFDRVDGGIQSVSKNDGTLIFEHLNNAFWRAPIDNDISIARNWRQAGLDSIRSSVEKVEVRKKKRSVDILVEKEHRAPGKECGFYSKEIYTINGDGSIKLETEISPFGILPQTLPRIGYELKVADEYSRVTWYGKGFGDSYPDRSEGMKTGDFFR